MTNNVQYCPCCGADSLSYLPGESSQPAGCVIRCSYCGHVFDIVEI